MFAQANSEHCRHKIFNATLDHRRERTGQYAVRHDPRDARARRRTARWSPTATTPRCSRAARCVAFIHAAIIAAGAVGVDYAARDELTHTVFKVETHNHPTAISPFPGASTGAGGEIRDEGATGRGAKPKAGLCGFSVSHLRIPDMRLPWEHDR